MNPNDPAAPEDGEIADGLTAAEATALANGEGARVHRHEFALVRAKPLPIDIVKAKAFLTTCIDSTPRVSYGLGAKASSDASQPGAPSPPGFTKIDCSGFVRAAIRRSTLPELTAFPDGSVVQHDWTQAKGFPPGAVDDGELEDGRVRIAFLPPSAADSGIGHVVLIHQGRTLESHGGTGPDSRQWSTLPWRTSTKVFELTW